MVQLQKQGKGEMKMDLEYLQKLSYLLKLVNSNEKAKKYQLTFEYENYVYVGDFIPKLKAMDIVFKDVMNFESDKEKVVKLRNEKSLYSEITTKNGGYNKSHFELLIERSISFSVQDYYQLLVETLKKYEPDFEENLPTYIYNVKTLNQGLYRQMEIMEVPKDAKFNYISIIPEPLL